MFGSISNWVNDNVPKPTMPTMPTMPTVNMPAMPTVNMPGIFNKNKDTPEAEGEGEENSNVEQAIVDQGEKSNEISDVKTEENFIEGEEVKTALDRELTEEEAKNGYKPLESAKEMGKNMGNMGKNMGNMLFSFGSKATSSIGNATTSLKDVIQKKTIIGDFSKENEKFVNDKKSQQRKEDAAVAPWVGYNEEEKLKEQIIGLSADSRNFLRPPPTGVEFQFDFNSAYPVAMAILEEDPALSEMRFKLVPKQVKEENFWLNYFYRVSLIKQSTTLEELAKQNDLEDADWDLKPEDIDNISPEELEKEINSMLG